MKYKKIAAGAAALMIAAAMTTSTAISASAKLTALGSDGYTLSEAQSFLVMVYSDGTYDSSTKKSVDYGIDATAIKTVEVTLKAPEDFTGDFGGAIVMSSKSATDASSHNWNSTEYWGVTDEDLGIDTLSASKGAQFKKTGDHTYTATVTLEGNKAVIEDYNFVQFAVQDWGGETMTVQSIVMKDASGNVVISFDASGKANLPKLDKSAQAEEKAEETTVAETTAAETDAPYDEDVPNEATVDTVDDGDDADDEIDEILDDLFGDDDESDDDIADEDDDADDDLYDDDDDLLDDLLDEVLGDDESDVDEDEEDDDLIGIFGTDIEGLGWDGEAMQAANQNLDTFGNIDLYAALGDDWDKLATVEALWTWTPGEKWCGGAGLGNGIQTASGLEWVAGTEFGAANANEGVADDGYATQVIIDITNDPLTRIVAVGEDGTASFGHMEIQNWWNGEEAGVKLAALDFKDADGNVLARYEYFPGTPDIVVPDITIEDTDDVTETPVSGDVAAATDSTKGSPNTGVADVAAVAGLGLVAAGAVIIAKKRK